MKLRVFQADKGDCLLLTSQQWANILIDGGMPMAYDEHIAPFLGAMQKRGEVIDLVYVSHIDRDHIGGVLRLLDSVFDWRVFDFQKSNGDQPAAPSLPRPPQIKGIWHNAFGAMVSKNVGPIQNLMAQSAALLSMATDPQWQVLAGEMGELSQSVDDALKVSQRIASKQLKVPLNAAFDGRLAMVREPRGAELSLGGMKVSVIGPFEEDLAVLRDEWDEWLDKNTQKVKAILKQASIDESQLGQVGGAALASLGQAVDGLGDRSAVTAPNLASLMLLVEESGKKVLLTGDGHWKDILAGLEFHRKLDAAGRLHVDVLKVQHHGAEHNWTHAFAEQITASQYVFCGNGMHQNPDLRVVESVLKTIEAIPARKASLLFNSGATTAPNPKAQVHMRKVQDLVAKYQTRLGARLKAKFSLTSSFVVTV
jgi:beta-lactamase superfamily II metal-dependent hydrolase